MTKVAKIAIERETPVERVRTTVTVAPVAPEYGTVEFVVEQSTYNILKDRFNPSKLVMFTLDVNNAKQVIEVIQQALDR